jgi:hypothetical protein
MKRIVVFMLFAFILPAYMFSQAIQYEFKVNYKNSPSDVTADITITVKKGESPFTYYLMTNDPVHGKVLMQSEPTRKSSYTFKDVKPGKYFMKIEDSTKIQAGKTINVVKNEN